jgi:hypothetical protein
MEIIGKSYNKEKPIPNFNGGSGFKMTMKKKEEVYKKE